MPLPRYVGETQRLMGDFTRAWHLWGMHPEELERRIGYRAGRLRNGWWLMFLTTMPTVDQFQYRGYTYLSGGVVQGHLPQNRGGPTAEDRLVAGRVNLTGSDVQTRGAKPKTIEKVFRLSGKDRIAKIRPVAPPHGDPTIPDYPPGTGVPQWTLVRPLYWVAAAFVRPGARYLGDYT